MAERGARPKVPQWRLRTLRALRYVFTPLLPDDYLELINPLWSTQELRGRIERVERETPDAATIVIKPGWEWEGHEPGQYLRIGMPVDGVHHWRAYSLTSDPGRSDGCLSITPKLVDTGKVSPYLVRRAQPGAIVRLGGVEGTFVLPESLPDEFLFISAGSGITPIMSMLRALARRDALSDVVLLHSARTAEDVIFGAELRQLAQRHQGFRLHEQLTHEMGRMGPEDLQTLCPDWREREAFISGPAAMLDALTEHWERDGDRDRLHTERFQPIIGSEPSEHGEGGTIRFSVSEIEAHGDGATPILVAGEEAGATLPFGCRMGICHTCVGELCSGRVRDLRTGKVGGQDGEMIRTCIHAAEGPVEIAL
ncbi:MAG: ferredoxin reductase [Solirubrobacteraceae bacterium]|nr:MAG: stearoyl-CoA 9-desaturase [Solirubrobacterales bacterium]